MLARHDLERQFGAFERIVLAQHAGDHLGHRHRLARRADALARQLARIAGAVAALVVLGHGARHRRRIRRQLGDQHLAEARMHHQVRPLVRQQALARREPGRRDVQFADVVQQPGQAGGVLLVVRQLQLAGHADRQQADADGVFERVRAVVVGQRQQHAHGVAERHLGQLRQRRGAAAAGGAAGCG